MPSSAPEPGAGPGRGRSLPDGRMVQPSGRSRGCCGTAAAPRATTVDPPARQHVTSRDLRDGSGEAGHGAAERWAELWGSRASGPARPAADVRPDDACWRGCATAVRTTRVADLGPPGVRDASAEHPGSHAGGHQPMCSADGRSPSSTTARSTTSSSWRAELAAFGHRFNTERTRKSSSPPTRMGPGLRPAVQRHLGVRPLGRRSGDSLWLSRDRFGVKPLYSPSPAAGSPSPARSRPCATLPGSPGRRARRRPRLPPWTASSTTAISTFYPLDPTLDPARRLTWCSPRVASSVDALLGVPHPLWMTRTPRSSPSDVARVERSGTLLVDAVALCSSVVRRAARVVPLRRPRQLLDRLVRRRSAGDGAGICIAGPRDRERTPHHVSRSSPGLHRAGDRRAAFVDAVVGRSEASTLRTTTPGRTTSRRRSTRSSRSRTSPSARRASSPSTSS